MEEEKIEDIQTEPESDSTSEETTEQEESKEPVESPKEDSFSQELEELQKKSEKPQRTELEKATFTARQVLNRIKELGGDPSQLVPEKQVQAEYVTKEDFAENYARSLTKSDAELNLVMWHYRNGIQRTGNLHTDIDNAYWLAHKKRIRNTYEELGRAENPPVSSGGAGQKVQRIKSPEMPLELQKAYRNRGFAPNKEGVWEAKHNKVVFDSVTKQWGTVRKTI